MSLARRPSYVATMCASVLLSACASIMHGTHQSIAIASEPYRAKVSIDGKPRGLTPLIDTLSRRSRHVVRIELEGYEPFETTLTRTGSGWGWGNLAFAALAPVALVIDILGGGIFTLTPDQVTPELTRRSASAAKEIPGRISVLLVARPDPSWRQIGALTPETAGDALAGRTGPAPARRQESPDTRIRIRLTAHAR
jgi:hypothetical protein